MLKEAKKNFQKLIKWKKKKKFYLKDKAAKLPE